MVRVKCSQWGQHPHEMYEEHETEGGIGELTLVQYDPPEVVQFPICKRCAGELWLGDLFGRVDSRFRWVVKPS